MNEADKALLEKYKRDHDKYQKELERYTKQLEIDRMNVDRLNGAIAYIASNMRDITEKNED